MPRFLSVGQQASAQRPIHGVLTAAAYKRLVVTGLPGARPDGSLAEGLAEQVGLVFDNLLALLGSAGLKREDLVAVRVLVTAAEARALVADAVATRLAGVRATAGVRQVVGLSQEGALIELDAEAVQEG